MLKLLMHILLLLVMNHLLMEVTVWPLALIQQLEIKILLLIQQPLSVL